MGQNGDIKNEVHKRVMIEYELVERVRARTPRVTCIAKAINIVSSHTGISKECVHHVVIVGANAHKTEP